MLITSVSFGFIFYVYYENAHGITTYPFQPYVSIFIIAALISSGALVYSIASYSRAKEDSEIPFKWAHVQRGVQVSEIVCSSCKAINDLDAQYCKRCGIRFNTDKMTDNMKTSFDPSKVVVSDKPLKKCSSCGLYYSRSREQCPFCGEE
jgi:RNA polymerase subunit RPABC4/transcription elongation factor Spt4